MRQHGLMTNLFQILASADRFRRIRVELQDVKNK